MLVDVTDDIKQSNATELFSPDAVKVYLDPDTDNEKFWMLYNGKEEQYAFGYGQKNV